MHVKAQQGSASGALTLKRVKEGEAGEESKAQEQPAAVNDLAAATQQPCTNNNSSNYTDPLFSHVGHGTADPGQEDVDNRDNRSVEAFASHVGRSQQGNACDRQLVAYGSAGPSALEEVYLDSAGDGPELDEPNSAKGGCASTGKRGGADLVNRLTNRDPCQSQTTVDPDRITSYLDYSWEPSGSSSEEVGGKSLYSSADEESSWVEESF